MPGADTLEFQNLSTVQSEQQPKPPTLATAATIAPRHFLTFLTGTTAIATITPPVPGAHMLVFLFATNQSGQFLTTGNIQQSTTTATVNIPVFLVYDPSTRKYYYRA